MRISLRTCVAVCLFLFAGLAMTPTASAHPLFALQDPGCVAPTPVVPSSALFAPSYSYAVPGAAFAPAFAPGYAPAFAPAYAPAFAPGFFLRTPLFNLNIGRNFGFVPGRAFVPGRNFGLRAPLVPGHNFRIH